MARLAGGFLALLVLAVPCARGQPGIPRMGDRDAAFVAATPGFRFHSDFWLNLHDYLYAIGGGGPDERAGFAEEAPDCVRSGMPDFALDGWGLAVAFYGGEMGERHHRRDPLMAAVRLRLAGLETGSEADPGLEPLLDLLRDAAPAYRACLWEAHDARNRRRIGELVTLLVLHGAEIRAELSRLYREPWPDAVPVDVVSYSDFAGANTASAGHTMLSSANSSTAGFSGLELVFHEASHRMFGPRHGAIGEALERASSASGVEPPGQLWHAVSFYTSGELVARVARAAGDAGFEPYALRRGLFDTAFRGWLEPIERHWRPYVDGDAELDAALAGLVAATGGGE